MNFIYLSILGAEQVVRSKWTTELGWTVTKAIGIPVEYEARVYP